MQIDHFKNLLTFDYHICLGCLSQSYLFSEPTPQRFCQLSLILLSRLSSESQQTGFNRKHATSPTWEGGEEEFHLHFDKINLRKKTILDLTNRLF
jgi:hypothetical protein